MRPFDPLFRNPHVLTILGNFWPREFDFGPWPLESRLVDTEPGTKVLVQSQSHAQSKGDVVLLHGLEGSGESGYMRSMAWTLLRAGFSVHRFHMRTCGGTEKYSNTLYHAGLTSDLKVFLRQLRGARPIFLCGFSLGGNVALKTAGEESDLVNGVCAVCTPIDLAMGVERLGKIDNRIYERRFVNRMSKRLIATGRYHRAELERMRTIYEIDDRITAPSFGFGTADNYYATQSARNFLDRISVPTLMLHAEDDTFVPAAMYQRPEVRSNPKVQVMTTKYGGHLGYLSRTGYRFWVDEVVSSFLNEVANR